MTEHLADAEPPPANVVTSRKLIQMKTRSIAALAFAAAALAAVTAAQADDAGCRAAAESVKAQVRAQIINGFNASAAYCSTLSDPAKQQCYQQLAAQVAATNVEAEAQKAADGAYYACMRNS